MTAPPRLLLFCDFPPSHLRGGAILVSRLLDRYPRDRLTVMAGSKAIAQAPLEGRLTREISLPVFSRRGRFGVGRRRAAADYAVVPAYGLVGAMVARRHHAEVVVTVAHGLLFLSAALAARAAGLPLVVLVHDDWAFDLESRSLLPSGWVRRLFGEVVRSAARVYVVSSGMQELLLRRDGVRAEVQLPAITPLADDPSPEEAGPFTIAYAGTFSPAVGDCLALLIDLVRSGELDCRLDLYMPDDPNLRALLGAPSDRVALRGWLPQAELGPKLRRSSALFLPFSFDPREEPVTSTAFPTKTTDYLQAARPIVVMGPPSSTIVRYARAWGFAQVVDTPDRSALREALVAIATSRERREQLVQKGRETLRANHDLAAQQREFASALAALAK